MVKVALFRFAGCDGVGGFTGHKQSSPAIDAPRMLDIFLPSDGIPRVENSLVTAG